MKNTLKRLNKDTAGFTLVELLIAVVILGIMATIAVVAVTAARTNAITAACKEAATTQMKALDQYFIDKGQMPAQAGGAIPKANLVPTYLHSMSPQVGDAANSSNYFLKTSFSGTVATIQGYNDTTATSPITDCLVG